MYLNIRVDAVTWMKLCIPEAVGFIGSDLQVGDASLSQVRPARCCSFRKPSYRLLSLRADLEQKAPFMLNEHSRVT